MSSPASPATWHLSHTLNPPPTHIVIITIQTHRTVGLPLCGLCLCSAPNANLFQAQVFTVNCSSSYKTQYHLLREALPDYLPTVLITPFSRLPLIRVRHRKIFYLCLSLSPSPRSGASLRPGRLDLTSGCPKPSTSPAPSKYSRNSS